MATVSDGSESTSTRAQYQLLGTRGFASPPRPSLVFLEGMGRLETRNPAGRPAGSRPADSIVEQTVNHDAAVKGSLRRPSVALDCCLS